MNVASEIFKGYVPLRVPVSSPSCIRPATGRPPAYVTSFRAYLSSYLACCPDSPQPTICCFASISIVVDISSNYSRTAWNYGAKDTSYYRGQRNRSSCLSAQQRDGLLPNLNPSFFNTNLSGRVFEFAGADCSLVLGTEIGGWGNSR